MTVFCARHPETETNVRCGRCDDPVCPRCMVHGPVGVRCETCGRPTRLPTFEVSGSYLARAIGAGIGLGIFVGALAGIIGLLVGGFGFLFDIVLFVGTGYVIGEGISRAVNQKRGRNLKIVAAGSMLLASVVIAVFSAAPLSGGYLIGTGLGVYIAINRF